MRTAEELAATYEVSFMAALFRITDIFQGQSAIVLWKMKNKPTELENRIPDCQIQMPGFNSAKVAQPKLRVLWSYGNYRSVFIPQNKSVPEDSSVYEAWENGNYTTNEEILPFGYNKKAILENKPVVFDDERFILTLIR